MLPVEVRQALDHLACGNEPNDGGDKRGRAGNIPAVGAFSGDARRADAVIAAADGSVFHGADGQFARVDDLQMLHAVFPAEPAHDARERADGGFIKICHAEGGGVYLTGLQKWFRARQSPAPEDGAGGSALIDSGIVKKERKYK